MTIEWLVPLGQARSMTMALHALSADIRLARGCTGCTVATALADAVTVRYVEEWQCENDLRDHLRSEAFGRLIALIEGASRAPRVEFMVPGGLRGLDYLAEVRRAPA